MRNIILIFLITTVISIAIAVCPAMAMDVDVQEERDFIISLFLDVVSSNTQEPICVLEDVDYTIIGDDGVVENGIDNISVLLDEYGDVVFLIQSSQDYWTADCFGLLAILPYTAEWLEEERLIRHTSIDNDIYRGVQVVKRGGVIALAITNDSDSLVLFPSSLHLSQMAFLNNYLRGAICESTQ
ncbi:MAG TPA: hypothetical protein P5513_03690 [Candidatus Diapherotrites archaeon]|nr:hypothetical protein [Candidatus Diapherotrites archaeon]